jgi:hypothetical protein
MDKLRKEIVGYFLLQDFFGEYLTACLVYEEWQIKLVEQQNLSVEHDKSSVIMQQIIQNAVILIQDLCFIKNREKFSPNDDQFEKERH